MKNNLLIILSFCSTLGFAQTFTNYTVAEGLVDNAVNSLDIDPNGDIWFGTQSGISQFDGSTWTTYDQASHPGLVNDAITALCASSDGKIWAGTDFGLSVFDGTSWSTYDETNGLADDRINCVAEAADGKIWVGNNDGVSIFDGSDWMSITRTDGLPFGGVVHVAFKDNGDALLGTGLSGLYVYDGIDFEIIDEDAGLIKDRVTASVVDEQGEIWVGNNEGISVFSKTGIHQGNHTRMYTLLPPDTLNPVVDLKMDGNGVIWAGIYVDYLVTVGGVAYYDGSEWIDYDETDGLVGPVIRQLAIADDAVWVATSTGVSKISSLPTSISEPIFTNNLRVYPTPSYGPVTIELDEALTSDTRLALTNMQQQVVMLQDVAQNESSLTLHLDNLSPGVYTLLMDGKSARIVIQ